MNRRPRISLDLLRAFRSAAAQLSFTRAAIELHVTQSAISHAVRSLEEQLGQALFHRVNRALKLTHAGEALYRAADQALDIVDTATDRLAGSGRSLGVTTTVALASLWLVPKLPEFARSNPGIDVRIVATNDRIDLEREHLDLALHFTPLWESAGNAPLLVDYLQFPVCSPALAKGRKNPLRTPGDLARHVRIDFETIVYGRSWYDWEQWSEAKDMGSIVPASTMRFSHYDQVIQAAIKGGGVAIGKWPHVANELRSGVLCAPFGPEWVARLGGFHLAFAPGADDAGPVKPFVEWLRAEVRRDTERAPKLLGLAANARSSGLETRTRPSRKSRSTA